MDSKSPPYPLDVIEERYARLFPSRKGTGAKPLRMALGSLIIQKFPGCSDRELVEQIKENPYLQYFIGLPGYACKRPFAPSLLVEFRKRLDDTILAEINELIVASNTPEPTPPNDRTRKNRDTGHTDEKKETAEAEVTEETTATAGNRGILTLDATCAPKTSPSRRTPHS